MLASILIIPDENQGTGSSIGSSLQVLEYNCKFPGFWDALVANASRIRVPCFLLQYDGHATHADWEALIRCLPELVYLKELDIPLAYPYISSRDFVDALRSNGTLQRVAIATNKDADFFDEAESHQIESYCKRNEAIPILLAKHGDDDKTDLSPLPMLFQSAKQAPRTAPNAMLLGLLAAGDAIGSRQQYGKRSHPDESV